MFLYIWQAELRIHVERDKHAVVPKATVLNTAGAEGFSGATAMQSTRLSNTEAGLQVCVRLLRCAMATLGKQNPGLAVHPASQLS